MHRPISNRAAYASIGVGLFGIVWSAIFVRWAGVAGSTSAFYRLALAQLVFVPWRLASRGPERQFTRAAAIAAVAAGVFFAADLAFFNTAIMRTSAANATLIGVNAPIFVALGAWALHGVRPTFAYWGGFALSLLGMVAIVGVDVVRHPALGVGDAMALAGAITYAMYLLFLQQSRKGMDALTFSALSGVVASITLFLICRAIGAPLAGFSPRTWGALVALALLAQVVGHLCVAYAMGKVPAPIASMILLAQAPLTALAAVPLLGERITLSQLGGGALVLAGICVVNLRDLRRRAGLRADSGVTADARAAS